MVDVMRWGRRCRTAVFSGDRRKKLLVITVVCLLLNTVFFFSVSRPRSKFGNKKYTGDYSSCRTTDLFARKSSQAVSRSQYYSSNYTLSQRHTLRDALNLDCTSCFKRILVDGPLGNPSSFGRVSTAIALSLDKFGWDVYLEAWNRNSVKARGGRLLELWDKSWPSTFDFRFRVSHPDSFGTAPRATFNVALTAWESTHLPDVFIDRMKFIDALFVPSLYNRDLFRSGVGSNLPIELFSHGVDPDMYNFVQRSNRKPFTFLFIATNTKRKNPAALIDAFKLAFPENEFDTGDVKLIMASTPPYPWNELADNNKDQRIFFSYQSRSDAGIRELYVQADCFVLPTRGEGFGLPVLEAMATGLPVITTDFGGVWDFCHPDLCYLARVDSMAQAFSPLKVDDGDRGLLTSVDIVHFSELMRRVYDNPEEARQRGKAGAEEVEKNWSWDKVVSALFPPDLLCND